MAVFDNEGKKYSVKKVLNAASGFTFDSAAYEAYSPVCQFSLVCEGSAN